jgi:anti-sigma factor RsiW
MSERAPTRDELLAMAYVDDELERGAREEFERRLAAEPVLRREVSALRRLEVLARSAAPPEIEDHEWAALARDPAQRGTLAAGWILAVLGLCGLAGYGLYALGASVAPLVVKLFLGAFLLGGTALFLAVLRARLRILPHDPYRDVQR